MFHLACHIKYIKSPVSWYQSNTVNVNTKCQENKAQKESRRERDTFRVWPSPGWRRPSSSWLCPRQSWIPGRPGPAHTADYLAGLQRSSQRLWTWLTKRHKQLKGCCSVLVILDRKKDDHINKTPFIKNAVFLMAFVCGLHQGLKHHQSISV